MNKNVAFLKKDNFLNSVFASLVPAETLLDIGCGIRPIDYIKPLVHICAEPYQEYVDYLIEKSKQQDDRAFIILKMGWEEVVEHFPAKSVDCVYLIDVIEHLDKETGRRLLEKSERLARKQLVVFTPLGFIYQHHSDGKDAWGLSGGEWQEHRSGWVPADFDESWKLFVCEKYHSHDNLGRPYTEPMGAFWGIKDIDPEPQMHPVAAATRPYADHFSNLNHYASKLSEIESLKSSLENENARLQVENQGLVGQLSVLQRDIESLRNSVLAGNAKSDVEFAVGQIRGQLLEMQRRIDDRAEHVIGVCKPLWRRLLGRIKRAFFA